MEQLGIDYRIEIYKLLMKNIFTILTLGVMMLLTSCKDESTSVNYSNDKSDIQAHNLINPREAYDLLLKEPNKYIPVQVSKEKIFANGHIKNSQNIWRPDYGSSNNHPYGGLIPSQEKLEILLNRLGFDKGKTLLLYDAKANVDALRFAWVLSLYGINDYRIISGGLKFWKESNLPLDDQIVEFKHQSSFKLDKEFDQSIIANFDEVYAAINDENTILIDTREDYEYLGEPFIFKDSILSYKLGAFDRGSIPTSIHLNWSQLVDLNGDHRIKSEKDLRFDLETKGITSDKDIILYCHSGSRTSHTFYVLKEILGFKKVKNYDGSWIEWSYLAKKDSTVPIQKLCTENKFIQMKDSLSKKLNTNE